MHQKLKKDAANHIPNVGLRAQTDTRVRELANRFYEEATIRSGLAVMKQFPRLLPDLYHTIVSYYGRERSS